MVMSADKTVGENSFADRNHIILSNNESIKPKFQAKTPYEQVQRSTGNPGRYMKAVQMGPVDNSIKVPQMSLTGN